ncbi:A24 family peptidase [Haemophilus pittmaniae]|uniref:A24 family peptidase n=1 Tax=Haemophilus pittmaniae TaxID=249188 RepID=UPI0028DCE5E0|nr:A24 family peptidase [Haemophilus pittmaniae]
MITFAYFFYGSLLGVILWCYIDGFMPRLSKDIWHNFHALFPISPPQNYPQLTTKVTPHLLRYCLLDGLLAGLLYQYTDDPLFAAWLLLVFNFLWAISLLDWQYQLISPNACLGLLCLGLLGAEWQFSRLSLSQSLYHALIFFALFYCIYQFAKYYYRQEALGRGDYWLALALGAYLPLSALPYFLLIACVSGILTLLLSRQHYLPFGPFLCGAMLLAWYANL